MTTEKSDTPSERQQLALTRLLRVQPVLRFFHALGFYTGALITATRIGFREGM